MYNGLTCMGCVWSRSCALPAAQYNISPETPLFSCVKTLYTCHIHHHEKFHIHITISHFLLGIFRDILIPWKILIVEIVLPTSETCYTWPNPSVLLSQCAPTLDRPRARSVKYGDRAISAATPALWNGQPAHIRCTKTIVTQNVFLPTSLWWVLKLFNVQRLRTRCHLGFGAIQIWHIYFIFLERKVAQGSKRLKISLYKGRQHRVWRGWKISLRTGKRHRVQRGVESYCQVLWTNGV